MNTICKAYDRSLASRFVPAGYERFSIGTYLKSNSSGIFYGIWVTLHSKKALIVPQPSLVVFCPAVSKIAREGLEQIYGKRPSTVFSDKLGEPVFVQQLYESVRNQRGLMRMPFSYALVSITFIQIKICFSTHSQFALLRLR
jgi:hypothetical protein